MIRARKTSRWLLVLAFTMRLSSLCWLAVTSIGTGAGMIGTLPKALHYTISFMGHDTRNPEFNVESEDRSRPLPAQGKEAADFSRSEIGDKECIATSVKRRV